MEGLRLHHVGIVVADLGRGVDFWTAATGGTVGWLEDETDVDPAAIGLSEESRVRLSGAGIALPGGRAKIELHQYVIPGSRRVPRRTCDLGIGHFAFASEDPEAAMARLQRAGVEWNSTLNHIPDGVLAGESWVYGTTPDGVVIQVGNPAFP